MNRKEYFVKHKYSHRQFLGLLIDLYGKCKRWFKLQYPFHVNWGKNWPTMNANTHNENHKIALGMEIYESKKFREILSTHIFKLAKIEKIPIFQFQKSDWSWNIHKIYWKNYACKEGEDQVNRKGYLVKHQYSHMQLFSLYIELCEKCKSWFKLHYPGHVNCRSKIYLQGMWGWSES